MNEAVLAVLALGVLVPAALIHAVRIGTLADAISAQRALPFLRHRQGRAPLIYAGAVVLAEALIGVLLIVSVWREQFTLAGLALVVLGTGFLVYVSTLRRKGYAGDCGCSPFEAAPSGWSLLPGGLLLLAGGALAVDPFSATSTFSSPAGTTESIGALLLAFTVGFLVWMFPSSVVRNDAVRAASQEGP